MSADEAPKRVVLAGEVDGDAIDDAARYAGWQLTNIIPGDARHPRQLLYSVFEGGWLYLVDDARFAQRWFQAEGPRQEENLERVRALLACHPPGTRPEPAETARAEDAATAEGAAEGPPPPHRPRLADHVLPRLHVMADCAHLLLHDNARGDALELEPEQFEWLELADGTRDEEGLVLELSRRGRLRKRSQLHALLRELHERGELAGGIPGEQKVERFEERPIRALPGLTLGCDGNGSCCRTYSSMLFDAAEASAARSFRAPGLTTRHARVFLPAFGADPAIQAVATRDGACVFLDRDSSCALHAHGAKPRGCRDYPLTLIDDGRHLAAVPVFECPCVERSFLGEIATAPPELPENEAGLAHERPVTRLRSDFALDAERRLSLAQLRDWVDSGLERMPEEPRDVDPVHWMWSWGDAAGDPDFEISAPPIYALANWIQRLQSYAKGRVESAAWRAPTDRTRRLVEWMLTASETLSDAETVRGLLSVAWVSGSDLEPERSLRQRQRRAEWAYVRCQLFGYQFAQGDEALSHAVQQRCARLLLARAMLSRCPDRSADDAARRSPLTALEGLLRSESLTTSAG
ncbi:MAG: YkgJ family cysteine cluster protein [Myxococcales bacterium]|nr:YkgJ family cysteine cluster protein [Myxococcales bacterium]